MPSEEIKPPRRATMWIAAGLAVVIGAVVVGHGLYARSESKQRVADWTNKQAIPSVGLAKFIPVKPNQILTLPGNIQPLNKAEIFARVNGYVQNWQHDIGTPVTAGQVLATIDAPDLDQQLSQAKATLASVRANLQIATLTANRNNLLVEKQVVAQQMADQTSADAKAKQAVVEANEANVKQLEAMQSFKTLSAPFDGIVTARNVEIGMLITSGGTGAPMFEVSDLHRVRVYVQVPQAFSAGLKPGVDATFEMPQYPGKQFHARLVHVSQSINAASHTMRVELQTDNASGELFAGAYCNVHFQIPTDPNMLQIPSTALIISGQGTDVATVDQNSKIAMKQVKLGRDFGDSVEVLAGLSSSDRVVNNPPETLVNGARVDVAQPDAPAQAAHSADASSSSKHVD